MKINIGLNDNDRKTIAEGLGTLLADTFVLYLKTHNYHWNVSGPLFPSLHAFFETQYTELQEAVDAIAERIRALDFPAIASCAHFAQAAGLKEAATQVPTAAEMVKNLTADHEKIIQNIRAFIIKIEETHDEATIDFLIQRLGVHEKTAWMLRSSN